MFRRILSLLLCIFLMMGICLAEGHAIKEYEYVDGIKCRPRQNIITYLFIGVDESGTVEENRKNDPDETDAGQSDFLMLLVIDKGADTFAFINIDRNTVTDVWFISDDDGELIGPYPYQISLAHANGDGKHQSCINTGRSVSALLKGIRIDHYASFTMEAVKKLNNAVGGVDIYIDEDLTASDPAFVEGTTVHLTDEQALKYIRIRRGAGTGKNTERMARQRKYLDAVRPKLYDRYNVDPQFPLKLIHSMDDCMVSDMTDKDFSYIAKALTKNTDLGVFQLKGETTVDENNWEAFMPDAQYVTDLVIDLFYRRVKE